MKEFLSKVRRFLLSEEGPTAIEYALMLALIVIVVLGSLRTIGLFTSAKFNQVARSLK